VEAFDGRRDINGIDSKMKSHKIRNAGSGSRLLSDSLQPNVRLLADCTIALGSSHHKPRSSCGGKSGCDDEWMRLSGPKFTNRMCSGAACALGRPEPVKMTTTAATRQLPPSADSCINDDEAPTPPFLESRQSNGRSVFHSADCPRDVPVDWRTRRACSRKPPMRSHL
jgi:hypothetical protein